jgi:hypothetical protein
MQKPRTGETNTHTPKKKDKNRIKYFEGFFFFCFGSVPSHGGFNTTTTQQILSFFFF